MLRLILLLALLFCVFVGGLAVALNHWFGWKGMVAFPFILLGILWLGKKLIGNLIKGFASRLISVKARALHGAVVKIHSITPVPNPPEEEGEAEAGQEEEEEEPKGVKAEHEEDEKAAEPDEEKADEGADEEEDAEEEEARERFELELTITPCEGCASRVWEPGELILTSEPMSSITDLEEKEVGRTEDVLVWDGSAFISDEESKYPGTLRLKLTISTKSGTSKAWLQYYNETIGPITLPAWTPGVEPANPADGVPSA